MRGFALTDNEVDRAVRLARRVSSRGAPLDAYRVAAWVEFTRGRRVAVRVRTLGSRLEATRFGYMVPRRGRLEVHLCDERSERTATMVVAMSVNRWRSWCSRERYRHPRMSRCHVWPV